MRLYLSTTHRPSEYVVQPSAVIGTPSFTLTLLHVRLPAEPRLSDPARGGLARSAVPPRSAGSVHLSFYQNGVFLTANSVSEERDVLVGMAPDAAETLRMVHSRRNILVEAATDSIIEGRTWAVAERPAPTPALALPGATIDDRHRHNELAMQHVNPPREFLCLTNTGLHLIGKLTPMDHLRHLLLSSSDVHAAPLTEFFDRYGTANAMRYGFFAGSSATRCLGNSYAFSYGRDEACAMTLLLIAAALGQPGVYVLGIIVRPSHAGGRSCSSFLFVDANLIFSDPTLATTMLHGPLRN